MVVSVLFVYAACLEQGVVLLVEYVEQFRAEAGVPMEEAVVEAGAVRLRPILMTTLTTVFGMMPLAIGFGQGSEMMQPLAIAVVGGMSMSTLLTLFVVPSIYIIIHRLGDRFKAWITGSTPVQSAPTPPRRIEVPVGGD